MFEGMDPPGVPDTTAETLQSIRARGTHIRRRRQAVIGAITTGALALAALAIVPSLGSDGEFARTEPAAPPSCTALSPPTTNSTGDPDMKTSTITVAAAATFALAGCAQDTSAASSSPTPATSSPSATTGTTGEPSPPSTATAAPPTSRPSATRPSSSATRPSSRDFSGVDWANVIPSPKDCQPAANGDNVELPQDGHAVLVADVTGDGAKDIFVIASCPRSTSPNPENLYVYDGASSPSSPKLLDQLFTDVFLIHMTYDVNGKTLRATAEEYSDKAPLCCPDFRYRQTLTWQAGGFVPGKVTRTPQNRG